MNFKTNILFDNLIYIENLTQFTGIFKYFLYSCNSRSWPNLSKTSVYPYRISFIKSPFFRVCEKNSFLSCICSACDNMKKKTSENFVTSENYNKTKMFLYIFLCEGFSFVYIFILYFQGKLTSLTHIHTIQ